MIGQQKLVSQLKKIRNEKRLGHAYAFSGPEGIGKSTVALAFAQDILCTGNQEEPCRCIACRTFREATNPDFYQVISDKPSIGVELIRDLQQDVANLPTYGNWKVYLIKNAELMTAQAQNCLLKTLEEPPAYGIILFTTTHFEAMLPTIQSRMVNFRLNPYSDVEMTNILASCCTSGDELEFILKFSRGIPGNAIHLVQEGSVRDLRRMIFKLLERPDDIYLSEDLRKSLIEKKQELITVLDILMSVYRDCLFLKQGLENRLINSDKRDMIIRIASSYSGRRLMDRIAALEKMRRNFKLNINYSFGIDVLLMEVQEV